MNLISWPSSPNKYTNRNHTNTDQAWKANGSSGSEGASMDTNA
ncbi:hypothetical protein HanIR_Chr12g0563321 [Helianthus annuus]|nr:hypothetical protein HanIR_Chr12g0563321 [Helianthus annuus]